MGKLFSKFRRNQDGSTAVEFAFTAPLLIGIVVAIMEFSMILFLSAVLEGSLRDAARFGLTGSDPVGISRTDAIVNKISSATMGFVPIDASKIDALVYSDFNDVGKPEPYSDNNPANGSYDVGETYTDINGNGQWDSDMGAPGLGGACDVVVYRIETEWPLLLGVLSSTIGSPLLLSASTAVRNEPFGNIPC